MQYFTPQEKKQLPCTHLKYCGHISPWYHMCQAMGCGFMVTESRHFCLKYNSLVLILLILICDEIFVFNREKQIGFAWVRLSLIVIPFLKFSVKFYGIDQESRNYLLAIHIFCVNLCRDSTQLRFTQWMHKR